MISRCYGRFLLSTGGLVLLTGCLPAYAPPSTVLPHAVATRQDSVGEAWRLVYGYVRAVDNHARTDRKLPATLDPVIAAGEAGPDTDVWGRHLRYRPDGLRFEVRSGGSDGMFDTEDDIVALGQLGRSEPCEIRTEFRVTRGVGFEPPCDADSAILVLPRCPQLTGRTHLDDEVPPTLADSIRVMGLRLVRIARGIDAIGRDLGGLPLSLRPIPSFSRLNMEDIGDIWRRPLRYSRNGREFAVHSAGPDGAFATSDDIVASGQLGQTLPCVFRTGEGMVTCDEPPPPCPEERSSMIPSARSPERPSTLVSMKHRVSCANPASSVHVGASAEKHRPKPHQPAKNLTKSSRPL
jgi:hypothetical protein